MAQDATPTPVHLHCCKQQMNHLGAQAHGACPTVEDPKSLFDEHSASQETVVLKLWALYDP